MTSRCAWTLTLVIGSASACDDPPEGEVTVGDRIVETRAHVGTVDRPRLPPPPLHLPAEGEWRLVVKFTDGARVRADAAGVVRSEAGESVESIDRVQARHGLGFQPLVRIEPSRIERLLERAAARTGRRQPDLLGLHVVTLPTTDRADMLAAASELRTLPQVEAVGLEALRVPPPIDVEPPTPSLTRLQSYVGPDPGIDAASAHAMGYDGEGIRLSDVEHVWLLEHEEWNEGQIVAEPGQTPDLVALEGISDGHHGAAVAGELIAGDNGYGVTGLVPGCGLAVYPILTIEGGERRADALLSAAADSGAGDVVLLEMQTVEGFSGQFGPAEIEMSVWLATQVATDAGIVVVAAAGNGNVDLDADELEYYRDRGDSGAIIVGAGSPITRDKLEFSTYGERVDVQGWGDQVFTAGYGYYAIYGDDPNQSYTATFSGTSSASPIVAGAAVLVQQAVLEEVGTPLSSVQMRDVLIGTGLPQGAGEHIGPLPQVPAAIEAALVPMREPPTVTITTPSNVQLEEPTFSTAVEIDASPVTAFVELSINGKVQPTIDDTPPFSFGMVEFPAGTWELVAIATSIWGAQGESEPVILEVGWEPPPPSESESGTTDVSSDTTAAASSGEPPVPDPSAADESTGASAPAVAGGSDDGCGCRTLPRHRGAWWSVVLLVAWRRRAKRRDHGRERALISVLIRRAPRGRVPRGAPCRRTRRSPRSCPRAR